MKRALAKGAVQFAFGRLPGGSHFYRVLTRRFMGTQASHVDKLARVWPGYLKVWGDRCGMELEGKRIWIHEAGYTVFPFLMAYIVTGRGLTVTNVEAELLDQYVEKSVEAALEFDPGESEEMMERQKRVAELKPSLTSAQEWVEALDGQYFEGENPENLSLEAESVDLAHSGGILEHYKPKRLREFLAQNAEFLKPGGLSSHIFDHRDHLYHADKQFPFLNHLRYSETTYRVLFGHSLTYHSRISPNEVREHFAETGLAEVEFRRFLVPDLRYVDSDAEAIDGGLLGLDRKLLHPRFELSDADLHTAAGHYLFRKRDSAA